VFLFFSAAWQNRQVPLCKQRELIRGLLAAGLQVALALPPHETPSTAQGIAGESVKNLEIVSGSVNDVAEVLKRCALCVSTDSAWLHMAFYLGVPRVGLFAAKTAEEWAPPGTYVIYPPHPIRAEDRYRWRFRHVQPLAGLEAEKVVNVCRSMLEEGGSE